MSAVERNETRKGDMSGDHYKVCNFSVGREGFMDKMSFKQNPVRDEGSSLQVPRGRKRQVKRSRAWHFQRGVRPVRLAE